MEERNIKITFEQAIKWYYSDIKQLRELALTAYSECELQNALYYIHDKVDYITYVGSFPKDDARKYYILSKLATFAKYFNGDWKKTKDNTGYFIGALTPGCYNSINIGTKSIGILEQSNGLYAGVIYFKNQDDLILTIKCLGERVKYLFD